MAKKKTEPREQMVQQAENREILSAAVAPQSLDTETRTVDVLFFSSIDVPRYDYYKGEPYILRFKPEGADLTLLNTGAPVFDNHNSWEGAASQMGKVEKGWQEKSNFFATLRFSKRSAVDGLWQDISDGIVQKFSMGVNLLEKCELEQEKGKLRVVEVTKWQPYEISTAPLPADNNTRTLAEERPESTGATSPKEQGHMEPNAITQAGEAREELKQPVATPSADELKNEGHKVGQQSENLRVRGILKAARACGLPASFAEKHITEGTTIEAFHAIAIDEQARISALNPTRSAHVDILQDEVQVKRSAMTGALLNRFLPGSFAYDERDHSFAYHSEGKQRLFDASRQYMSCSLLDIAKECLDARRFNWRSMNRNQIAEMAFQSTSDFPFILADVTNKSLRAGYDMMPAMWRSISARRTAADFKSHKELVLDSDAQLQRVRQSGEFTHGALVEGKEEWSVLTYGRIISITRQAIVNDDLGAFTRAPQLLGQEVARLEADIVFGIITANAVLSDSVALFHTTHGNHVDSGGAIDIEELSATRALMMLQTSPGGKPLNIIPRYLLVPVALAQVAAQYTSANYVASQPSNINPFAGQLTPIVEPRLDADDDKAFYMFADPNSPNGACIIHAYLEGQEAPYTQTQEGFHVDGVQIKIRHDFGAGAIDYRGGVKNDGE